MAKNIKYQIPFGSDQNTEYRIDIFAEYDGTPIILMAGDTPIVTSEENNEGIETALRPSTGTIQICTKVPAESVAAMGKDMLTIEDLLPEDNLACPILLRRKEGNRWSIDWKGFLSCEVYNQDYVSTPQNLELPIISFLEAMDSVKFKNEDISGFLTIKQVIAMAFEKTKENTHLGSLYDHIYFPEVNYKILNKYIDPRIMIEMSMHDNENRVDYIENGNSYKTILENICVAMGWCAREQGVDIYFMPINHNTDDSYKMVYERYTDFVANTTFTPLESVSLASMVMSGLDYMGIGHKKSINQGKTFVEIIANIKKYDQGIELPSFPRGELFQADNDEDMYVVNNFAYSRFCHHRILIMNWTEENTGQGVGFADRKITLTDRGKISVSMRNIQNYTDYFNKRIMFREWFYHYAGVFATVDVLFNNFYYQAMSFRAKWKDFGTWNGSEYTPGSDIECLVLYGIPDRIQEFIKLTPAGMNIFRQVYKPAESVDNYIYRQDMPYRFFANQGKFKLNLSMGYYDYISWDSQDEWKGDGHETTISIKHKESNMIDDQKLYYDPVALCLAVCCGDKWWNGESWGDSYARFWCEFDDHNNCEMEIPITEAMSGDVSLYITPYMRGSYCQDYFHIPDRDDGSCFHPVRCVGLTRLSLTYENDEDVTKNDAATNNYFRLLGTKFHDGLSIHTDIASYNWNLPSPSLIVESFDDNSVTFMKYLEYILANGTTAQRRIEIDLLDRLSKWYSKIRRKIDLEVSHPGLSPLPMTRIYADDENGYDGKHYIPIAESRDWKSGVSTLTCLEDSDGDE